ncbi:hypothetical protein [Bordetella sp. 15P40C-2]|uniref:hypothetical protein n=1 Tax=Bordetella sp. 15P40C-2 TaxID=2572246 RepID=UPI0013242571|nr:hypothetical protein [Bordetella sp. 15P40C-2]MVW70761.1 hypothetical protein [Bordetella sp. 15P40C-2]
MNLNALPVPFAPTVEQLSSLVPSVNSVRDVLKSAAPWIATIAAAITVESVIHPDNAVLQCITGMAKQSAFAGLSLMSMVGAFRHCMEHGFFSLEGLSILTSGASALVSLDGLLTVAAGVGLGLAEFSGVAGLLVTGVTFAKYVRDGDVPGALLTGAKLVALVALTGHPVALGIVVGANAVYSMYCSYKAYAAGQAEKQGTDAPEATQVDNTASDNQADADVSSVSKAFDEGWDLPNFFTALPAAGI